MRQKSPFCCYFFDFRVMIMHWNGLWVCRTGNRKMRGNAYIPLCAVRWVVGFRGYILPWFCRQTAHRCKCLRQQRQAPPHPAPHPLRTLLFAREFRTNRKASAARKRLNHRRLSGALYSGWYPFGDNGDYSGAVADNSNFTALPTNEMGRTYTYKA